MSRQFVNFVTAGLDVPERWTTAERMADDSDPCHATSPGAFGYLCTGPEGHGGPHYADGLGRCVAAWRDDL